MSYSSTDLHTQLRAQLDQTGYQFHEDDNGEWSWSLGDRPPTSESFDSEAQAEADAAEAFFQRSAELQTAAAVVVNAWFNTLASGLDEPMRALFHALDSITPGDTMQFVKEAK